MTLQWLKVLAICFRAICLRSTKGQDIAKKVETASLKTAETASLRLHDAHKNPYIHATTNRSPEMLANLPTEIIDQILCHLDEAHWLILRNAHRMFQASAQSLQFREIKLLDWRRSTGRACKVEQLLHLLEDGFLIRGYVRSVRVGSVLDPTVREDVAELLPRVLELVAPKEMAVVFRELAYVTRNTQEKCAGMLVDILRDLDAPNLVLECDYPSVTIFNKLGSLPISTFVLSGEYYPTEHGPRWREPDWMASLCISTLHRIDLGDAQIRPYELDIICKQATNLTELHLTIIRTASSIDITHALDTKKPTLRSLSLRRLPACKRGISNNPPIDLSTFTALKNLSINASFLFGAVPCPPTTTTHLATAEVSSPSNNMQDLSTRLNAHKLLPPNLTRLHMSLTNPQTVFPRSSNSSSSSPNTLPCHAAPYLLPQDSPLLLEFAWLLEIAEHYQSSLKHITLTENAHDCEGSGNAGSQSSRVRKVWLDEGVVAKTIHGAFGEEGVRIGIWVVEEEVEVRREVEGRVWID